MPPHSTSPSPATSPESGAWDSVRDGWQQVYGSFARLGVSVELHDFEPRKDLDWGRSFHRGSVEICLNLSGSASIGGRRESAAFESNTTGLYAVAAEPLPARRPSEERHHFVTIELRQDYLARELAGAEDSTHPVVRSALRGKPQTTLAPTRPLSAAERNFTLALTQQPALAPAALPFWYQSKVAEATALFLFPPAAELFCARQKRMNTERVERVCEILRQRLEDPPSLEALGREVGVSPFYLSRLFSEEMHTTIPRYLRRLRMERAAELLRGGGHNVTEAAFAVGYASLGHFSKTFCEVIGSCPAIYALARGFLE